MFTEQEISLLGLSKKDNKILQALAERPLLVAQIAKQTKIKRTTLYSLLAHLSRRNLVETVRRGKRKLWQTVPPKVLQEQLFTMAETHRVSASVREHEVGIIASQDSEYKIYRGKNKLLTIYKELATLPRNTRLFGIQPNNSVASSLKNVSQADLVFINEAFKKRHIVVESILQEDFLPAYLKSLKGLKRPVAEAMGSYSNRLAVTTYIPKDTLDFDAEIIFYGNVVLFVNWQELVAIVIKNKDIAGIMKALFELSKLAGQRVDQNPQVAKYLNK